jgi:hypothetical protein
MLERGQRTPPLDTLESLAKALSLSATSLRYHQGIDSRLILPLPGPNTDNATLGTGPMPFPPRRTAQPLFA